MLGLLSVFVAENAVFSLASEKSIRHIPFKTPAIKTRPLSPHEKQIPKALKPDEKNDKMSGRLKHLISRKVPVKDRAATLSTSEMESKALGKEKIRVVFRGKAGFKINLEEIKAHGGRILNEHHNLVAVEVPVVKIEDMVNNVDGIEYARLPYKLFPHSVTSEGVNLTGADNLHSAGFTGTGIKVAVIDIGFKGLSEAQSSGDIPYGAITHDYTGMGLETQYKHGTACAEIIYDMAPNVELHLLKISDEVDFYSALDYALDNDIDIVSLSIGTFGTGPGDGTGPFADICNDARANGILVVASAGNSANYTSGGTPIGSHWKGMFLDQGDNDWWGGGNDLHRFIPNEIESRYNAIGAFPDQDDDGNPETDEVTIIMRWNDWPNADIDYDIYLFDYYSFELIAYSNDYQTGSQPPLETIVIDLPDSEDYPHYYTLVVSKPGGEPAGTELELYLGGKSAFVPYEGFSSPVATSSSSISEPADAQSVFSVGAIDYSNWATGPQEEFSSQGPTNAWAGSSARVKPDISGPDGVSGLTYGASSFYGTSATAPHVAGAAALILSMHPNLSPDQLQSVIESSAVDMGSAGKDNLYGWGRLSINVYNSPPVLDLIGHKSVNEGDSLSFLVSGMDPDWDSLTYSVSNPPSGANFDPTPAMFTWIPDYDQAGIYNDVHFEVSDGMDTDWENITVTVNNVYYDIDDSGTIDLNDAILALQICAGITPSSTVYKEADVDGDGKIGLGEAIHALQIVSGLRSE